MVVDGYADSITSIGGNFAVDPGGKVGYSANCKVCGRKSVYKSNYCGQHKRDGERKDRMEQMRRLTKAKAEQEVKRTGNEAMLSTEKKEVASVSAFWRGLVDETTWKHEKLVSSNVAPILFMSELDHTPSVFYAKVELDDYYNYSFDDLERIYLSLDCKLFKSKDSKGKSVHCYVPRDSKVGRLIKLEVADGETHKMLVKVAHPPREESSDMLMLLDFEMIGEKNEKSQTD